MGFLKSVGRNALIVAVLASSSAYAAETVVDFNVPRGDLGHVVEEIAAAGGSPVAFPSGVGAGLQAGPIIGRKTVRQALNQALAGSGLALVPTSAGGFTVRAAQDTNKTTQSAAGTDIADIDVAGGGDGAAHGDQGFQGGDTGSITRLGGSIAQTPLSITAVTKEVIQSENVTEIGAAAINSAGVTVQPQGVSNVPYFQIRGFSNNIPPTMNGAQTGGLAFTPIDDVDRIEVLKGPTSILTGVTEPGGQVNVSTKLPTEETVRDVTVRVGSYGYKTLAFDFGGFVPQTEGVTYRFNISGNNANTNYAGYKNPHEYLVSPSVNWKDKNSSVTFGVRYFDVVAGSVPQTYFDADKNPIPVARGVPQGNANFNTTSKTADFYNYASHDFGSFYGFDVAVENKITYELQGGQSYLPPLSYLASGTRAVFYDQNFLYANRTLTEQANVSVQKDFGWFKDKVRLGFDYIDQTQHYGLAYGTPYSYTFDLTKGYTNAAFAPTPLSVNQNLARTLTPGVSFGDKVDTFNDRLHIFGQVREDHFGSVTIDRTRDLSTTTQDVVGGQYGLSWTAGGAFDVTPWMTVYGNRNNGFTPVIGASATGGALLPEQQDQSEVGARFFLFDKRLTLTTSFYKLSLLNLPYQSLTSPGEIIQVAGQTTRGFEFEAQGQVLPGLDVIASFADQHANFDQSYAATQASGTVPAIGGVPQLTASLWAVYTLQDGPLKGVFFGAGGNGNTHTQAAESGGVLYPAIPGYVVANFGVGYTHDRYSINVKLNNAFNRTFFYATTPIAGQPIFEGQQRNVLVTAKYSF